MPDVPGVPSAEELAALPHGELAAQLAEACRVIADQAAVTGQLRLRAEQLEHRGGKNSSTSPEPPSPDSPYKKKPRDRSRLMAEMAGVRVSPGWIAPVRAEAAALAGSSGFMDLVKGLLR